MLRRLAIALVLLPIAARAAESCPWLNAATAGGVLGGTVSAQVTHPSANEDDAACAFELRRGELSSRLTVNVTTMGAAKAEFPSLLAQCGADKTELKAIGNEAFACGGADHGERWQRVVGRVRDRAFVIELRSNDPTLAADALAGKAHQAAEQVAGILY